jgi:chromosomal replication initiator protein
MDAASVWSKACKHLRETLSRDVFDRWIAVIDAKSMTEDALVLGVQNNFYQSWLESNYLPLIEDALAAVHGQRLKITFDISRETNSNLEVPTESEPVPVPLVRERATPTHARQQLNPRYTFDTFIIGPSNSFPHAASMAVAQSPGRAYNPLFIYGGTGQGKTHLMQAIGHHVQQTNKQSVCYLSCETFTNEYIDALQRKSLVQFRKKYRNVDLLLLDDVQFLGGKERMQEEFFHTFNALHHASKQIVLTCDRPASEIPGLEHRLVSRFEWGLVTQLEQPDVETRTAILRRKQEEMKVQLPAEVINYLAENIRSNIRRLEGALVRVVSYGSLTGRALNVEVVEHLLRDTLDQEQESSLTMEEIQKVVADFFDIRMADMTSNRRPQNIAFPRQVAMYLCREMTEHSLPSIGTAFARNHATVLHAHRLVGGKIKSDGAFRQNLVVLQQRLSKRAG